MTNQKKVKLKKPENLKRKPQNELDARCLAMKRRRRVHAEITVGQAVSNAAEQYDRADRLVPGGSGDIIIPMAKHPAFDESDRDEEPDPLGQLPPSPPPHDANITGEVFAFGLNEGFHAGRRQREEEDWRNRYPAMFPVFLACQQRTNNWSNVDTRFKDWKGPCNCTGTIRTFDVLDLTYKVEDVSMFP
ncbi:uncharacterized protein MELLADRAFT_90989 [Melampsora larici-populina 98AG31]|uniref:CxC1-like cysteine cluster associated with KDZ transposases domain-containing protein n=1 Tax=Melampsora larici-populina (strain 98AG31 / pathotype 3-4-7) TaxID=747676 RepID=F4R8A2_MELLP|nr:uncharacterized protein MELLADRAFT_90989 [Melampsora larici-populina 98AG31]EGG11648.1 hypothetical protein MELLADRAFT_90989 [Melampsora larici-populina 98AG31]